MIGVPGDPNARVETAGSLRKATTHNAFPLEPDGRYVDELPREELRAFIDELLARVEADQEQAHRDGRLSAMGDTMNAWPSEQWISDTQDIWEYVRDQNQRGRYPRSGEAAPNRGVMLHMLLSDGILRNRGSDSARLLVAGEVEPWQHYKPPSAEGVG